MYLIPKILSLIISLFESLESIVPAPRFVKFVMPSCTWRRLIEASSVVVSAHVDTLMSVRLNGKVASGRIRNAVFVEKLLGATVMFRVSPHPMPKK